jgi:flagellar biosynthesis/type III secretory pathway chaperone
MAFITSQSESAGSAKPEPWDGMKRIFDSLLKILGEEIDLYGMVLNLARDEKDAMMRSDLDALRTATDGKTSLVSTIQGLERKRQAIIEDLSKTVGRPAQELTLRELSRLAEEPFAAQLKACGSDLLSLASSISEVGSQNREVITHRLRLVRSSFSFLNHLTASSTVYHNSGKMMMTSARSGRVLSGEY